MLGALGIYVGYSLYNHQKVWDEFYQSIGENEEEEQEYEQEEQEEQEYHQQEEQDQ